MDVLRRVLADRGRTLPRDIRHDAPLTEVVVDSLDLVAVLVDFEEVEQRWCWTVAVSTRRTDTKNTPIEALERSFPMRVEATRLRRGTGGAGAARGGDGIVRDLRFLEDVTVSLITERRTTPPPGLAGGSPGAVGENLVIRPGADEPERLPDKCTLRLPAGSGLRMHTPSGAGWGQVSA